MLTLLRAARATATRATPALARPLATGPTPTPGGGAIPMPPPPPHRPLADEPPPTRGAAGGGEAGGGGTGPESSSEAHEDDRTMTQRAADAMRRAKGTVKAAAGEHTNTSARACAAARSTRPLSRPPLYSPPPPAHRQAKPLKARATLLGEGRHRARV